MMFKRISTALTLASMVNVAFATSPPNYYQITQYANANCSTEISSYLVEFGVRPQGAEYTAVCSYPGAGSSWTLDLPDKMINGAGLYCVNYNSQSFTVDCTGGAYNNSAPHAAIDTSAFTIQIQSCSSDFSGTMANGQNVTLSGSNVTASFTCDSQSTTSAWTGTSSFDGAVTYYGDVSNQCSGIILVNCAYSSSTPTTSASGAGSAATNTPTTGASGAGSTATNTPSASGAGSTATNSASSNTALKQTIIGLSLVIALLAAI